MSQRNNGLSNAPDPHDRPKDCVLTKELEVITSVRHILRTKIGTALRSKEQRTIDALFAETSWKVQVAACETKDDFLALFSLHGIAEDVWRSSWALNEAHGGLYQAIKNRFQPDGGWSGFLTFMGPRSKRSIDKELLHLPFTEQVAACETKDDFLALFALHGIAEDVWRNSGALRRAGYAGLYVVIMTRFKPDGGWDSFLMFMGAKGQKGLIDARVLQLPYTEQVAACKTRADFLALFALHGIAEEVWRIARTLCVAGYVGLYMAISTRFKPDGGWDAFLAFMDGTDEASMESTIQRLGLEEAVALLGHQPGKLKAYLSVAHPNLLPGDIDHLVAYVFQGLHTRRVYDYSDFELCLKMPTVAQCPKRTHEAAVCIAGVAPGADCVLLEGVASTRRITVAENGTFQARVSLAVGQRNDLRIIPLHHGQKRIGPAAEFAVRQTGEPDDIEALVSLLDGMGKDVLDDIRSDPGRHEYVVRQAEQALIRKFSGSFAMGKAYVEGLIAKARTPVIRAILKQVLKHFTAINMAQHPNVKKGAPLYFFQKYCVAEIQRAIAEGKNGIVLANDPGLGKTRTALVAINGDFSTIITPNSVVSSWAEEAQCALNNPDILVLRDMHSRDRKNLLRTTTAPHCVTNVEFLRSVEGDERYGLLADEQTIVVQDEAHGLLNLESEQSKGARRLRQKFLLLLSATPAKDPKTLRRILHLLEPNDPRFSNDKAFTRAFPGNDPEALKTLHVLKQRYMIRFTKEDVLETMDPAKPLSKQRHRLPRKEYVPEDVIGAFTLTEAQCDAIYGLFRNFPEWTKTYDRYIPKDAVAREDQLRGNGNALVKTHALRQTANNPAYIGSHECDPKAQQLLKAVDTFLAEGRKVVIFCQYNAQAQKYAELLKAHCPSVYTGLTGKQGYCTGTDGKPVLFKKNAKGAWEMDARGLPKEDPSGEPMPALDYERLAFQHAPQRRVMIATYAAGSVGVTFTAGKATIFDDLPEDVVREIQAEDRTHRIDHEHQTHHSVKYARMVAHYPEAFLERMKRTWLTKQSDGTYVEVSSPRTQGDAQTAYDLFFAQGTYDEVRLAGLQTQRMRFRLINDGIVGESDIPEINNLIS